MRREVYSYQFDKLNFLLHCYGPFDLWSYTKILVFFLPFNWVPCETWWWWAHGPVDSVVSCKLSPNVSGGFQMGHFDPNLVTATTIKLLMETQIKFVASRYQVYFVEVAHVWVRLGHGPMSLSNSLENPRQKPNQHFIGFEIRRIQFHCSIMSLSLQYRPFARLSPIVGSIYIKYLYIYIF